MTTQMCHARNGRGGNAIFSLSKRFYGQTVKKIFDAKMSGSCFELTDFFSSDYKLESGLFALAIFLILLTGVQFFVVGCLACKIRIMKRYVQYSVGAIFK